ncbi:MAG TPA: hypothetical protein VFM46_10105, partial [Pseudomonadales bacterium]|nr:hypothetical protein [Pseudomonadales bacterium]
MAENADKLWSVSVGKTSFNNDGSSVSKFVPAASTVTDFSVGLDSLFYMLKQKTKVGVSRVAYPDANEHSRFFG